MDGNDSELHGILDRFVRTRIKEILYDSPTYFRGRLTLIDLMPHFREILPQSSYEKLERDRDREGNARSIDFLLDILPRHQGFGLRLLQALVATSLEDVARRIMQGFDRPLPRTRYSDFLEDLLPRPPPSPPPYSPSSGSSRDDQEKEIAKWNNLRSPSSGPLSHLPSGSDVSNSAQLSQVSSVTDSEMANGLSDLRLNILSSTHSRQSTCNVTSRTASRDGAAQTSSESDQTSNPTDVAEDHNPSPRNPTIGSQTSRYHAVNSGDRIGFPDGDVNLLQRPHADITLATVAEGTTNYPPSPAGGKDEEAAARCITKPTGDSPKDVSSQEDGSNPSSLCVSSTLTIDTAVRQDHAEETIPKEVGSGSVSRPAAEIHPQNETNDLFQEDIPSELLCISASLPSPDFDTLRRDIEMNTAQEIQSRPGGGMEIKASGTSLFAERVSESTETPVSTNQRSSEAFESSSSNHPEFTIAQVDMRFEETANVVSNESNAFQEQIVDHSASDPNISAQNREKGDPNTVTDSSNSPSNTYPEEEPSKERLEAESVPLKESKLTKDAHNEHHTGTPTPELRLVEQAETRARPDTAVGEAPAVEARSAMADTTGLQHVNSVLEDGGNVGHLESTRANEACIGSVLTPRFQSMASQLTAEETADTMSAGDAPEDVVSQIGELRGGDKNSRDGASSDRNNNDSTTCKEWTRFVALLAFAQIATIVLRRKF